MNRTKRFPLWSAIVALLIVITGQHAVAADRYWSNGGGDSLWSNPANWLDGVKPVSNDTARLQNHCPDAPQNIILDENAWLTAIICIAAGERHYTVTPISDQFIRLNSTYALNGTTNRTVDLTINADIRLGGEYLRVSSFGGDTILNGNVGPSLIENMTNVYILAQEAGRLVLAGSNTITHVYGSTDSRVVAANAYALGTYYRTASAPKSLMLRQSVLMTGGNSPLLTLFLEGPLELGIEENGTEPVELTVMARTIGHTVTMTRGANSTGDFIVRAATATGVYTTRWITMEGSALVMNNPSGTISWGNASSDIATISGPGRFVCEEPSNVYLYSTNSYTGGTFIRGGTLELKGANRLPTNGAVTVESPGTLYFNTKDQMMSELHGNGKCRLTWATVNTPPATNTVTKLLSPGVDGPGTLTFMRNGCLVLTPETESCFELDALNATHDLVKFEDSTGHLVLDGKLKIVNLGGVETGDYTLFDLIGGTVTGEFSELILPSMMDGTVEVLNGDVVLRVVLRRGSLIAIR